MGIILKLFGILDLAAAGALLLAATDILPGRWVFVLAIYLIIKGVVFVRENPVSFADILIGAYLALTPLFNIKLLSIIFGIYLGLKAIYSFV